MTRDEHRAACIEAIADALYITPEEATTAFDALHGIARVNPIEATAEMIEATRIHSNTSPENLWRVMARKGNLLNAPEKKP